MASLERSVEASKQHVAAEEAAEKAGSCPHIHLQEWLGAEEPLRCQRCSKAITEFGWAPSHVEQERAAVQKVDMQPASVVASA